MTAEESVALVKKNQNKLQLTDSQFQKWAGKRYIVLIEVNGVQTINSFTIDKKEYGNMDDWLPVGEIDNVRK